MLWLLIKQYTIFLSELEDPLGLKEFEIRIWIGGSVGYAIVGGGVYDITIMDVETGETTLYTVKVLGLGVGLPSPGAVQDL
ncbi:hypothetical protein C5S39_07180 [Candidatus Methanophagaceae archaeon]|nr:hypothetical protein C5S39_07180 [Methanophagales archaeon]